MATTTDRLKDLLQQGGTWTTVYTDGSGDRENPRGLAAARRTSLRDRLGRVGASDAAIGAVDDALEAPTGLPSPISRFLLVHDDLVLDTALPGEPESAEVLTIGVLPSLVPLLQHETDAVPYLVVETNEEGGTVALHRAGGFGAERSEDVASRAGDLGKAHNGAWNHSRYPHHVEDVQRRTQQELATSVDRLVQQSGARLVVVSGDGRARELLVHALGEATRSRVAQYERETNADGADQSGLVAFVDGEVARVLAEDGSAALDRYRTATGRDEGLAVHGTDAAVEALRQAQVDSLFLDPDSFGDMTLLALDASPWVATSPADVDPAGLVGPVPAVEGLIRAAVLTDANVRLVPARSLDGEPAAALLRWAATATMDDADSPRQTPHHRSR